MPDWLSYLDVAFVAVVAWFAWRGAERGFAGQIAPLITFAVVAVLMFFAYPHVFNLLDRSFRKVEEIYFMWLILAGLFLLALGVFSLISKLLAGVMQAKVSVAADRGWGATLGLFRGVLTTVIVMMLMVMLEPRARAYDGFRIKSHVGKLVCYELVPRVQPHLSRTVLENRTRSWRNALMDREEAGRLE